MSLISINESLFRNTDETNAYENDLKVKDESGTRGLGAREEKSLPKIKCRN